jgi:dTDP-4-dehydrorhamnose reductase
VHILILGWSGQLGRALLDIYQARHVQLTLWALPEFDFTTPAVADQVAALGPDLVINAAAWTDVDGAQENPDLAYAANALGPKYVAEGCARCGAPLVQVSTNEVFPGLPGQFYREYDPPAAGTVYARSKLAGERAVTQMHDRVYIVRVAWLFGQGPNNFPLKILAAADRLGALRVVDDEFGNPTYARDAATAIVRLTETGRYGIYHLVNAGYTSRYEFARQVLACAGRSDVPVTPIAGSEWVRRTTPPPHAVLVNQAAAALGIVLPPWQEAVADFMSKVVA